MKNELFDFNIFFLIINITLRHGQLLFDSWKATWAKCLTTVLFI